MIWPSDRGAQDKLIQSLQILEFLLCLIAFQNQCYSFMTVIFITDGLLEYAVKFCSRMRRSRAESRLAPSQWDTSLQTKPRISLAYLSSSFKRKVPVTDKTCDAMILTSPYTEPQCCMSHLYLRWEVVILNVGSGRPQNSLGVTWSPY